MNATMNHPKSSPWGAIHDAVEIAPGIVSVGTASHGGLHVDRDLNAEIPDYMRSLFNSGPWYEEDCEWSAVFVALEEYLVEHGDEHSRNLIESGLHRDTLRNDYPDAYAEFYGVPIESLAGESREYDRRVFEVEHANEFVAVSAFGDWHENVPTGSVGVIAVRGGRRTALQGEKFFLVAADRYANRSRFGYVIAPDDIVWTGP